MGAHGGPWVLGFLAMGWALKPYPELQQYLKNIKVVVTYEDEDKDITWVAENTATHTTRRLEFLVERVATALIPPMSVWMDHSEAQIGTVDTCFVCSRDDG
ncbi:hypothetical protein F4802DRAFT_603926 [Xylaria palmicola]|nr:hypothetical protein F4802DRAFT_603926 [Xylaria palmicola]